jgi:hypothetical protein
MFNRASAFLVLYGNYVFPRVVIEIRKRKGLGIKEHATRAKVPILVVVHSKHRLSRVVLNPLPPSEVSIICNT